MTIETRYSINDIVWTMHKERPYPFKVRQVEVTINKWNMFGGKTESYFLADGNTAFCHHEWYPSHKIFPTKEALLQSL